MRHVHPRLVWAGDFIISVDEWDIAKRDRTARRLEAALRLYEIPGEIVVIKALDGHGGYEWQFWHLNPLTLPLSQ